MRLRFTKLGGAYLALMLLAVAAVLYATIRIYTADGRGLSDIYSACLGHTAAVMGIFAIIGAGDMFFRFEESKELQEARRKREEDLQQASAASEARLERALAGMREDREIYQTLRERERAEERAQREQERAEERALREQEQARREQERAEERAAEQARWEQEHALREREQTSREQERAQHQQLLTDLMAQNLEMNNRLLNMLERRNGHANGNGASEPA